MQHKKCFSLIDCSLKSSCTYSQTHENHANGWFQPQNTGDNCSYFKAKESDDQWRWLHLNAGAHE
jgi:hypothetical protein